MMNIEEKKKNVCDAWRIAVRALGIKIEIPYLLKNASGEEISTLANLPDFGGPNGMVIDFYFPGDYRLNERVKAAAQFQGKYYSFINVEVYEHFDEEVFKEALIDWGFFGDKDCRPDWLPRPANT